MKIAVLGSINLDIVASGAPLPRAGETVFIELAVDLDRCLEARRLDIKRARTAIVNARGHQRGKHQPSHEDLNLAGIYRWG